MDHRLLIRVTAPAVLIGLILFGACVAGAVYIKRLQTNLTNVLNQNVTSLESAENLEMNVRQLRFHNLVYLIQPSAVQLTAIEKDQQKFEAALAKAREAASTQEEKTCVGRIDSGYAKYQQELAELRANPARTKPPDSELVSAAHPIPSEIKDQCEELLNLNHLAMRATADESQRVTSQANLLMILLGLGGPISGIILGYGVARGLSRSIYRLSVRVHDAAQRLERDIASVNLVADGDLQRLDRQLQQIVGRAAASRRQVTEAG